MSYYRNKRIVLKQLNSLFEGEKNNKTKINVNSLKLQLLLNNDIGELTIDKMLVYLGVEHGFKVEDGLIKWD